MTRWGPTFVARFLATPRISLQTKQPRTWPSSIRPSRTRSVERSQLRFTPITAGKIEPWVLRLLICVEELLDKGCNDDALALCHDQLWFAPSEGLHGGDHDCYHRLISLFTRHGDLKAAVSLCNRMQDEGYVVPSKTLTTLLRSVRAQDAKHVKEVHTMLASGGATNIDDVAFKLVLDSMVLHNATVEDLERAFGAYETVRGEGWVAPRSAYGVIIKGHALAEEWSRAHEWLEKYRRTLPLRNTSKGRDVVDSDTSDALARLEKTELPSVATERLRVHGRKEIQPSAEHANFPYAALLMGYVRVPVPPLQKIDCLLECMRLDGVKKDTNMCNMLIRAYSRWGLGRHAYAVYLSMIAKGSVALPDAYTFRTLFILHNPKRHVPHRIEPPEELTARRLFKEMIALNRMHLHPRQPLAHKNLICPATFNCALRTFLAQGDYAAAWTVITCFPRYHLFLEIDTIQTVTLSLIRRMGVEFAQKDMMDEVIWTDRFMGEPRSRTVYMPNDKILNDRLLTIGHDSLAEMEASQSETYLKPSSQIEGAAKIAITFIVAMLRVALQASLGISRFTQHKLDADMKIKSAMLQARIDMIPPGRLHRN